MPDTQEVPASGKSHRLHPIRRDREEGFPEIAYVFEHVCITERSSKKEKSIAWRCRDCGYLHYGTEAPMTCPACAHPQAYFEILAENW